MSHVKVESTHEKQNRLFKEYIQKKKILIVDSQAYSRSALARTLIDLGATMPQIQLESTFVGAEASMQKDFPDVVIAEYDLEGGACGLDLLSAQRKSNVASRRSLFILVTSNTSQAAVARAAEEDVDGYLLKPYTNDGLRMAVMKYAVEKAYPSVYTLTIESGKEKLVQKQIDDAMLVFKEAMPLDPKPALAYFYHGLAHEYRKTLSNAESDYLEGLHYNKMHYKCLVALFDLFMAQKRNKEAYEIVRKVSRYFPANPDRLATVLRLAVMNEAYEDIERYYQLFCKLDARDQTLIRYVCAALIVCGKYYLTKHENARAVELFNRAKATGARNPKLLKEMVSSLLQHQLVTEAAEFLKYFPPEFQATPEYLALRYAVDERGTPVGESIAKGRALITQGNQEYILYYVLIHRSIQAGFQDHADQLLAAAIRAWPDKENELKQMIQKTGRKAS